MQDEQDGVSAESAGCCPECGGGPFVAEHDRENYRVLYRCPGCGYEGEADYADLYGCMAVPWGGTL
jgi:ribosomal protein S27AE